MKSTERGIRTYRQTGEQPEKQRKTKNKKLSVRERERWGKQEKR